MTVSQPLSSSRRRAGALAVVGVLIAALFATVVAAGTATAASSSDRDAASAWLAAQVTGDGSVTNPFGGGASVDWTVNVAVSLALSGTEPDALDRAMTYISANAEAYLTDPTANTTGRYGWLMLLSRILGLDPQAFGDASVDLVAGLNAQYEEAEPGLFGPVNTFGSVFNQSLALLGLVAAGETPPADAVAWLVDQQCDAPSSSAGGWQPYRAPSGGGLAPCAASDGSAFTGADANSTSFAIQALVAVGADDPVADALAWLHQLQVGTGTSVGGFGQYVGDAADPNSTAVAIQAIVAAGQNPASATWALNCGVPVSSLDTWIVRSGADAGALSSPFSDGFADIFATYQGVWGLAQQPFPVAPGGTSSTPASTVPASVADACTPTTTSTTTPPAGGGTGATGGAATPISGTPAFTG